jgi:enoyl-[acyl-carrier-protein] reductase (NADH)
MEMNPGKLLVTGGTRGIGLAIALEAARHGATVCITHRWGSVAPEEIEGVFRAEGLQPPRMEECDASDAALTAALVRTLYDDWGGLDSVVSGVAFGAPLAEIGDLRRSSLEIALGYTAWPLLDLVQATLACDAPPRRFLALSSLGVERALPGYEMIGIAKGALETLVRYLAVRLRTRGSAVNALRFGYLDTESLRAALPGAADEVARQGGFMAPETAGRAAVALLSGMLDGMTGQVVTVDEGVTLLPPFSTSIR